jgi:hypothetical protein
MKITVNIFILSFALLCIQLEMSQTVSISGYVPDNSAGTFIMNASIFEAEEGIRINSNRKME